MTTGFTGGIQCVSHIVCALGPTARMRGPTPECLIQGLRTCIADGVGIKGHTEVH